MFQLMDGWNRFLLVFYQQCFLNSHQSHNLLVEAESRCSTVGMGRLLPPARSCQSTRIQWILCMEQTNAMVQKMNGFTAFHQSTRMGSTPRRKTVRNTAFESMGKDTLGIVWREHWEFNLKLFRQTYQARNCGMTPVGVHLGGSWLILEKSLLGEIKKTVIMK